MNLAPERCSKKKRFAHMQLLHSSIEHFFIVQAQHPLMLLSSEAVLLLALILRATLLLLPWVCLYRRRHILPPRAFAEKSEARASLRTEGPLLLPGLDVITAAPLPPIGAAVFYSTSAIKLTVWPSDRMPTRRDRGCHHPQKSAASLFQTRRIRFYSALKREGPRNDAYSSNRSGHNIEQSRSF